LRDELSSKKRYTQMRKRCHGVVYCSHLMSILSSLNRSATIRLVLSSVSSPKRTLRWVITLNADDVLISLRRSSMKPLTPPLRPEDDMVDPCLRKGGWWWWWWFKAGTGARLSQQTAREKKIQHDKKKHGI